MNESAKIVDEAWAAFGQHVATGNGKFPQTHKLRRSFWAWNENYLTMPSIEATSMDGRQRFAKAMEQSLRDGLHVTDAQLIFANEDVTTGSPIRAELARILRNRGRGRNPPDWREWLNRAQALDAVAVTWDYLRSIGVKDCRSRAFEHVGKVVHKSPDTLKDWWKQRPFKNW